MLASGLLTAAAEQVTVTFDGTVVGTTFAPPEGWGVYGDTSDYTFKYYSGALRGYDSSAYGAGTSNPIVVTPPVQGTVTVRYRVDEPYDYGYGEEDEGGYITFYDMTKSGETYIKGNSIGTGGAYEFSDKVLTVDAGQCVGIQMQYADVMSVTYEPYDDGGGTVERRAMTIGDVAFASTPLFTGADGNVSAPFTVTVINSGNVALNPGDENYTLTLYTETHGDLVTIPLTEAIAVGESKTMSIAASFPISLISAKSNLSSGTGAYYVGMRIREDLKQSNKSIVYTNIYPYAFNYKLKQGNIVVTSLDFGFVSEPVTRTLTISNEGGRDMVVTSITLPQGFSTDAAIPFTVSSLKEAVHTQDFNITLGNDDTVGILSGDLVMTVEGMDEPVTLPLSGAKSGGDLFFEGFENESMPAGWIIDDGLQLILGHADAWGENNHVLSNEKSVSTLRAITPRLTAAEGEKLLFQAGATSKYGQDACVTVYYSTDRTNWEQVKNIRNASYVEEGDESFSSQYPVGQYQTNAQLYTVDMPAGEGYLAFDICYARIDNVFGCRLVAVDHDLALSSFNAPATGIVNNAVNSSMYVKNVNTAAEAAGSYTVSLNVNGEDIKTMTETPEIAGGAVMPLVMSFTPHQAGTYTVKMRMDVTDDLSIETEEATVTVAEETALADVIVGAGSIATGGRLAYTTPLCNYYKKAESQLVFTQEYLAQYGITPGTKLTGIAFNGWMDSNKTFTGKYRVAITPTELSSITPDQAVEISPEMVVYSNRSYIEPQGGEKDTPAPILKVELTMPYTYQGGNILVDILGEFDNWSYNCQYVGDASLASRAIMRSTDNDELSETAYNQASMFAQTVLTVENNPLSYAGTVVSSEGNQPVEGADVVLTSGEVEYRGVTDADGAFSIVVFQSDKDYDVTVNAEGYNEYTSTATFADGSVQASIVLTPSSQQGVDGINADSCNVRISGDMIAIEGAIDVRLAVYSMNGMLCGSAAGDSISIADLAEGIYILRVEAAEGNSSVRFVKK